MKGVTAKRLLISFTDLSGLREHDGNPRAVKTLTRLLGRSVGRLRIGRSFELLFPIGKLAVEHVAL